MILSFHVSGLIVSYTHPGLLKKEHRKNGTDLPAAVSDESLTRKRDPSYFGKMPHHVSVQSAWCISYTGHQYNDAYGRVLFTK